LNTLQRIPPAVRQIAEILDRMLGLSTVAHSTFKPEPLNITDLVEDVYEDLHASEPPPSVELTIGELPDVIADERMVRVLLTNLLSNSMKFTRGSSERRIEISATINDGVTVYCITDNGIGFDQGSANKLFIAFQKLDEGKVDAGVGLGLAIVARVVGRHGGRIWAEGVPGERASFFFTLAPKKSDLLTVAD
jgi:signal transduction histidine kinase